MSSDSNKECSSHTTNYTMMQAFEWYVEGGGKHWKKFTSELPRLTNMGLTALWLPPPTKAAGQDSVGYDIYDVWDLGEFDQKGGKRTNYGTKEELVELTRQAKQQGLAVYIDAVLNHKFGADRKEKFMATEVDGNDRTNDVSEVHDIEGWTGFDFSGRNEKHSSFKWDFNHFTGVDYDALSEKEAIFRIQGDGKSWSQRVDTENGCYDFLMGANIDHAHPDVSEDLKNWGAWIINELGADGFRFDAIKHIDEGFIAKFVGHVRETSKKPKMFCVGEFWKDSIEDLQGYLERFGQQFSVFDAPLHYNFKEAGEQGNAFDLRSIWDGTVIQNRPMDACTLVDNHDTQVGQSLESWVPSWFKPLAYALILLRVDGYPCIFYGDLYGCGGESPQKPMAQLPDFIRSRKLFAYGELRDYWDHQNCVGWVRMGDQGHDGCAVVICNGDEEGTKRMEVGSQHAGEKWTDVLQWSKDEITIGEDGWAEFRSPARSVSIWTSADARGRGEFKRKALPPAY